MTTPRTRKPAVTRTTIPAGAAVPQDRKPPKDTPTVTVPWAGQEWVVEKAVLDDIEFLEAAEKNFFATCGRMLVGEAWDDLKDALRDEKTGRTSATEIAKFVKAAAEATSAKNS